MIPPHHLNAAEFPHVVRGYGIREVDEYVAYLKEQYEILYHENESLQSRVAQAEAALDAHEKNEAEIGEALMIAQRASRKIIGNANAKAAETLAKTKEDCEKELAAFRTEITRQREILAVLKGQTANLKQSLFEAYSQHISMIEQITPNINEEIAAITAVTDDEYARSLAAEIGGKYVGALAADGIPVQPEASEDIADIARVFGAKSKTEEEPAPDGTVQDDTTPAESGEEPEETQQAPQTDETQSAEDVGTPESAGTDLAALQTEETPEISEEISVEEPIPQEVPTTDETAPAEDTLSVEETELTVAEDGDTDETDDTDETEPEAATLADVLPQFAQADAVLTMADAVGEAVDTAVEPIAEEASITEEFPLSTETEEPKPVSAPAEEPSPIPEPEQTEMPAEEPAAAQASEPAPRDDTSDPGENAIESLTPEQLLSALEEDFPDETEPAPVETETPKPEEKTEEDEFSEQNILNTLRLLNEKFKHDEEEDPVMRLFREPDQAKAPTAQKKKETKEDVQSFFESLAADKTDAEVVSELQKQYGTLYGDHKNKPNE